MNVFSLVWQEVLKKPFFNLLIVLYQYLPPHDFGVSVLVLTVLIRIVLWPLNSKAIKNQVETQKASSDMQERMDEVKKKYKDEPQKQSEEMMKVVKESNLNLSATFLPLIVQIIVLIAFYHALQAVMNFKKEGVDLLYNFVNNPQSVDPSFLGIIDLSEPSVWLAVLAGISQYVYSKMSMSVQPQAKKKGKKDQGGQMQKMMQNQMVYFMPIITIFIGSALPSTLVLYWLISTLFMILQHKILYPSLKEAKESSESNKKPSTKNNKS